MSLYVRALQLFDYVVYTLGRFPYPNRRMIIVLDIAAQILPNRAAMLAFDGEKQFRAVFGLVTAKIFHKPISVA